MRKFFTWVAKWTVPTKALKVLAAQHQYQPGETPLDMDRIPDTWLPPGLFVRLNK